MEDLVAHLVTRLAATAIHENGASALHARSQDRDMLESCLAHGRYDVLAAEHNSVEERAMVRHQNGRLFGLPVVGLLLRDPVDAERKEQRARAELRDPQETATSRCQRHCPASWVVAYAAA